MKSSKQYILDRIKVDNNGCWIWQLAKNRQGYGTAWFNGVRWRAHRFSYTTFSSEIPKGKLVCHSCDNPPCVNPEHLWIGTHDDNRKDCKAKGRLNSQSIYGEKNAHSKLSETDVIKIRNDRRKHREIAKDYCVNRAAISKIKSRKLWAWL